MKKKITFLIGLSSMALSGFIYANQATETATDLHKGSLNSIEALSSCEVSSNASDNRGYCSANYGGGGDSCTTTGDPGAVRCSGNF